MEKIIYLYTEKTGKGKSRLGDAAANLLGIRYPVLEREIVFAGCQISAYGLERVSAAEAVRLGKLAREPGHRYGKKTDPREAVSLTRRDRAALSRFRRTMRYISRRIEGKEARRTKKTTSMPGNLLLFRQWEDFVFPTEVLTGFYRECQQENVFVFRAEQLIFLDVRGESAETGGLAEWDRKPGPALMWEIYTTFNYVTIVTEREEDWQEFAEAAYDEYGLSVRCVRDGRTVSFRDKPTLIVDLCREESKCCRSFPKNSVYMDLRESRDKAHRISVRCGEIPYISVRNALDTALRDTV